MNQYSKTMYAELLAEIEHIHLKESVSLSEASYAVEKANEKLHLLKAKVKEYQFDGIEDEVFFYKTLHPQFYAMFIYYSSLLKIETTKLSYSNKGIQRYLRTELKKIYHFTMVNQSFYQYYMSSQNHFDIHYFTRKHSNLISDISDDIHHLLDKEYCTLYSVKAGKILANKVLKIYIERALLQLQKPILTTTKNDKLNTISKIEKVKVNLSVDQFAIFLKATVDGNVIKNVSYNWIATVLAPYLATKKTDGIAVKSIRNKGIVSAMEQRDIEVVKEMIMTLYKIVCRY